MPRPSPFVPALLVIDVQNDFLPPTGSLAVPSGTLTLPHINTLLTLPFALKLATKDSHPPNHISFATSHTDKQPFVDFIDIPNPSNPTEIIQSRLWPVHCVEGTAGWEFFPELETGRLDGTVLKGRLRGIESYSAFGAPFERPRWEEAETGLEERLRERGVTDVFVVGLALDYCVKETASDAVKRGFRGWVVKEGTRAVDAGGAEACIQVMGSGGVRTVDLDGEEVGWVRALAEGQ